MILLFILGALIIGSFIAPYNSDGFWIFLVFSIIGAIVNLVANAAMYLGQVENIEKIPEAEARQAIFVEKANALTGEFKMWLGKEYPDVEKEIFKSLTPATISIFAAKFPEIKSSETIMNLVSRISDLQSSIYREKLDIEGSKRRIRITKRNPFILNRIIPIK